MRLIGMFVCVCGVHVVAAAQTKMREDMFILKVHGARDQREVQHHEPVSYTHLTLPTKA